MPSLSPEQSALIGARALSIRAPWVAWIMGTGPDRKCWENRVWKPQQRPSYRGPILIHMSLWWRESVICDLVDETGRAMAARRPYWFAGIPNELMTVRDMKRYRGHILGWCDLADIAPASTLQDEFWVAFGGQTHPNHCALRIENPRMLESPIPVTGRLGLFKVTEESFK